MTTELRKVSVLSTTSSQTGEMFCRWNREAGARVLRASRESVRRPVQRSPSSPDLQALLRKAKAKLRAALDPSLASPTYSSFIAAVAGAPFFPVALQQKNMRIAVTDDHHLQ